MEQKTSYITLRGKLVGFIWPNDDDEDWNGDYQKHQYYSQAEHALLRINMDSEGVPYYVVHIGDKRTDCIGIVYKAFNDLWYWVLDSRFNGEPQLSDEGLPSKRVARTNLREAHWNLHKEGMPSASRVYYDGKTIGYVFAVQERMPAGWLWRHYANDEISTSSFVTGYGAQDALLLAHRSYLARQAAAQIPAVLNVKEPPTFETSFHKVLGKYLDVRESIMSLPGSARPQSPWMDEYVALGEKLDALINQGGNPC